MQDTINHSGYVLIRRELQKEDSTKVARATVRFAYDFNCGDLVIHAYERIPEIDGTNAVVAYDFDNKGYLFCSQLPFSFSEFAMYPQNIHQKIDFVVKNYEIGSKYKEVIFDFAELQYFCPSGSVVKDDEERNVTFSGESKKISVQAIVYGSAYIGILYSTAHDAQSSQASCPSTGWPTYFYDVVVR